jgi:hypothetical protein
MPKKNWIRCILVSAVFAALLPLISDIVLISDTIDMPDLSSIDADQLEKMSPDDLGEYMETVPMRKLEGFDRFTYPFTHPQFFHFYLRGAATSFVWLFLATTAVSYLGHRSLNDA